MPESTINFISEYEYRGEVFHHFRKNDFGQYPMDFLTYPSWESEKDVLHQPMLFMPESRENLILDFENGRKAFSNFKRKDFGQDLIDLKLVVQGLDYKGLFRTDPYKFKPDAYETIALQWLEKNTYGTVLFGTNPYLAIKTKNCQFRAIDRPKTQKSKNDGISVPNRETLKVPKNKTPENFEDNGKPSSDFQTLEMIEVPPVELLFHYRSNENRIINPMYLQLKSG